MDSKTLHSKAVNLAARVGAAVRRAYIGGEPEPPLPDEPRQVELPSGKVVEVVDYPPPVDDDPAYREAVDELVLPDLTLIGPAAGAELRAWVYGDEVVA